MSVSIKPAPQRAVPICASCGFPLIVQSPQCSHHAALCAGCEDELAPAIGERFRDVLAERAFDNKETDQ